MRTQLTEEELIKLISSMQMIIGCSNAIKIEYFDILTEYKEKLPQIKAKALRILSDAEDIKKVCYKIVKQKEDEDQIDFGMGFELHRVTQYFSTMDYSQLKNFNDLVRQHPEIDVNELSNKI